MGLMGRILGAGGAARRASGVVADVAEVFVGNRAGREAAAHEAFAAVVAQAGDEFAQAPAGRFDGFVNGLNRLPRPMLALGTLALFGYAMAEPDGFGVRMQGLALVPEPLWWLLGAIVSFYFGARELHYWRGGQPAAAPRRAPAEVPAPALPAAPQDADAQAGTAAPEEAAQPFLRPRPRPRPGRGPRTTVAVRAADPGFNAALEEWRALRA
jgi:hypothetical protein